MKNDRIGYYFAVVMTATLAICVILLVIAATARLFDWIMP